jgi:carboxypeptidase C (cathepsin A)
LTHLRPIAVALALVAFAASAASAQHPQPNPPHRSEDRAPAGGGVLSMLPKDSVTEHTLDAGGAQLAYTATAGTFPLIMQNGEKSAAIFYTAYALKGAPAAARPVTFVFNGGPGASAAYLHLGLVGPKAVTFGAGPGVPASALHDNPDTWLKFTDLVLIDPVGTGWSRAAKTDDAHNFWSVQADAESLAKVIALYVAHNDRAASPKYILGESYGGFRAVKVARTLQQNQGMLVDGIVMLSPLLDAPLVFGGARDALGAALRLPSLAAAELDRRDAFTPEALAVAERFAINDYLVTLAGAPPRGEAAQAFYQHVAELTGIPLNVVTRTRGFIGDAYEKRASAGVSQVVSPYDGAVAWPDPFPESESSEGQDPILDGRLQALGGAFVAYARDELGFKTDITYSLLNREVSGKWDWGRGGRNRASVTHDMRELFALNPAVRVLIAHGRSDLVTPFAVSRYVLDHMPDIGPRGRAEFKVYKGGHMIYLDPRSRAAFTSDAAAFYAARK